MNQDEVNDDSDNNENDTQARKRRARVRPKANKEWWSMVWFCCFWLLFNKYFVQITFKKNYVYITISNT